MKNNIFLHLLYIFIYSTILIAENTFPSIGQGQLVNISMMFLVFLIRYKFVQTYEEVFIYGFLTDSLVSNFSFGFFTCIYLIYLFFLKNLNVDSFREVLFIIVYIVHFLFTSIFMHSFSWLAIVINLFLYLILRFLVLIILKK